MPETDKESEGLSVLGSKSQYPERPLCKRGFVNWETNQWPQGSQVYVLIPVHMYYVWLCQNVCQRPHWYSTNHEYEYL